jgi:type II secretory pathway pseudopilin PulG
MIEIAISLAVIGFALVAIVGVLPLGMNVQRENREETIINQDATVLLSAIRNGARGMDDLANYVIAITNYVTQYDRSGKQIGAPTYYWYTPTGSSPDRFWLTNGTRIVGLMSTPKYVSPPSGGGFYSNRVIVCFRSMSGPASEKFPQNNAELQKFALSYRMLPEVVTFGTSDRAQNWGSPNLRNNLHEVRLTFRWPLERGTNAPYGQVFRTLVGGSLQETNELSFPRPDLSRPSGYDLYFFQPGAYVKAP